MQIPPWITNSHLYRELAAAGNGFMAYARGQTLSDGTPRGFSQPAVASGSQAAQNWVDQAKAATENLQRRITNTGRNGTYSPSGVDLRSREFRRTAQQLENVVHGNTVRNLEAAYGRSRAAYESTLNPRQLEELQRIAPDQRYAAQQAREAARANPLQARPNSVDYTPAHQTAHTANAGGALNATDPPRTGSPSSWQRFERIYNAPPGTPAQRVARSTPSAPLGSARPRPVLRRFAGTGVGLIYGFTDLFDRVLNGQDYGSAAMTAVLTAGGGEAGALVGASAGAVLGPPGIVLGGLVGGALGAGLGSTLGDQLTELGQALGWFPRDALPPPDPISYQSGPPFRGGQTRNRYTVSGEWSWVQENGTTFTQPYAEAFWGPITYRGQRISGDRYIVSYSHHGAFNGPRSEAAQIREFSISANLRNRRFNGPRVSRVDGTTEAADIAQSIGAHPLLDNPREPVRSPARRQHPANTPTEQYVPGGLPSGGTQRGDSPDWMPALRPAPGIEPPAEGLGGYLPGLVPAIRPASNPTDDGNNRANPGRTPGAPPATGGSGASNWRRSTPNRAPVTAQNFPGPTAYRREVPVTDTVGGGQGTTPPPPADPNNPCRGNRCQQRILDRIDNNGQALDNLMNLLQSGQLDAINAKLDTIDKKLGAPLPNGGISQFLKGLWNSLNLQRVINLLTFITTLHNAYMVSNALTQTLFSAFDQVLNMFRIQLRNADGDEIDTSTFVGNSIEAFFNRIFGTETVDGIQDTWKRASRIYQAATNILFAMQSIMYSALDGLEAVADRVSVIGNALRKWGQVGEQAYGWMNPKNNFMTSRFFRFTNAAGEAAELIETVAGSVVDIQESSAELANQTVELNRNLRGVDENGQPTAPPAPPVEFEPILIIRQGEEDKSREMVNNIPPSAEDSPPPPADP